MSTVDRNNHHLNEKSTWRLRAISNVYQHIRVVMKTRNYSPAHSYGFFRFRERYQFFSKFVCTLIDGLLHL